MKILPHRVEIRYSASPVATFKKQPEPEYILDEVSD
jgi:hypothetical protein